jgi:toxin ParE1/3/4
MALEVRLTPGARRDLAGIYDWSAGKFGLAQADRYAFELNEAIQFLAENPGLARDASRIRAGLLKHVSGSHVVYMRVSKAILTVVRILHGSMDAGRWL